MMDIVVILACLYFAYQNVTALIEVPIADWELVQYLLVLVTLGLVAVAALRGRQAWRDYQKEQKKAAEAAVAPPLQLEENDKSEGYEDEDTTGTDENQEEGSPKEDNPDEDEPDS